LDEIDHTDEIEKIKKEIENLEKDIEENKIAFDSLKTKSDEFDALKIEVENY
jgi:predicted RNase H-like nuclease (RuvC/YqgF family)